MYGDGLGNYRQQDTGHTTLCWIWQGAVGSAGYGTCWDPTTGRVRSAHRMSWEQLVESGDELPDLLDIHHECEQKLCLNPDHMKLVTRAQHNKIGARKMTQEKADELRGFIGGGGTQAEACEKYGISQAMVSNIVNGKAWVA